MTRPSSSPDNPPTPSLFSGNPRSMADDSNSTAVSPPITNDVHSEPTTPGALVDTLLASTWTSLSATRTALLLLQTQKEAIVKHLSTTDTCSTSCSTLSATSTLSEIAQIVARTEGKGVVELQREQARLLDEYEILQGGVMVLWEELGQARRAWKRTVSDAGVRGKAAKVFREMGELRMAEAGVRDVESKVGMLGWR